MAFIPKIIHYCSFGKARNNVVLAKCRASWKLHFSGYELKEWNESNIPLDHPYVQKALKEKQYSRLSNFIRLYALHEEGGIYLDTDIEVIRSFDPLLSNECFLGFQLEKKNSHWLNNCVMGALPQHGFVKKCMDDLVDQCLKDGKLYPQPELTTRTLQNMGLVEYGIQKIRGVMLYPKEYFFPYFATEIYNPSCLTEKTYCIHHWEASWVNLEDLHQHYGISKKFIVKLVLWVSCLGVVGIAFRRMIWTDHKEALLQTVLIVVIAALLFLHKAFHSYFRMIPALFKTCITAFLSLIILGHLLDVPRATFPFDSWEMFGSAISRRDVDVHRFYGHKADEEFVFLVPPRLIPALGNGRMTGRMKNAINLFLQRKESPYFPEEVFTPDNRIKEILADIRTFVDEEPQFTTPELKSEIEDYLKALGDLYNDQNPQAPLETVSSTVCRVFLDDESTEPQNCYLLLQVSLKEEVL